MAGLVIVGACDVVRCAASRFERLRQAEVEDLHRAVGLHLDVRRFQIAMNDPLLMRGFERLGNLFRDGQRLVDRDRPARNALRQVLALDEFHHEGLHAVGVLEPVDRGDVRMIQRGEDFRFALKAGQAVGVGCERRWKDLDGDVTLQLRIARAIHLAHAPGPKGGKDFVRAKACAGVQGQTAAIEYTGRAARRLHYF